MSKQVARMKRSGMWDVMARIIPDSATLHPGYAGCPPSELCWLKLLIGEEELPALLLRLAALRVMRWIRFVFTDRIYALLNFRRLNRYWIDKANLAIR